MTIILIKCYIEAQYRVIDYSWFYSQRSSAIINWGDGVEAKRDFHMCICELWCTCKHHWVQTKSAHRWDHRRRLHFPCAEVFIERLPQTGFHWKACHAGPCVPCEPLANKLFLVISNNHLDLLSQPMVPTHPNPPFCKMTCHSTKVTRAGLHQTHEGKRWVGSQSPWTGGCTMELYVRSLCIGSGRKRSAFSQDHARQ